MRFFNDALDSFIPATAADVWIISLAKIIFHSMSMFLPALLEGFGRNNLYLDIGFFNALTLQAIENAWKKMAT